jgi:hypothetical protein
MSKVDEIEAALRQLPDPERWEVARWLLSELEKSVTAHGKAEHGHSAPPSPDYAARRRLIFGEKVVPNMVLISRSEEPC